ncbi:polyketide cyclase [Streptomyces sp. NK08204]|uniref:polyketide cyclase n=1 Tax=Streptomyces sp. NK08204 TaxID=2873260 RepID=UPI001CEC37F8|nr:polyketide cyclase [Streptomyces sp. NK08204]
MWTYEHSLDTEAAPEAIWRLWADVGNWGAWNADIRSIRFDGPFAAGAEIVMNPDGEEPVHLVVTETVPGELFVDEARFGGMVLRTTHRIDRDGSGRGGSGRCGSGRGGSSRGGSGRGGSGRGKGEGTRIRVTYRMEITGEGADEFGPKIGPAVTEDWPETMAALVEAARR